MSGKNGSEFPEPTTSHEIQTKDPMTEPVWDPHFEPNAGSSHKF
jgi:hypothetical protein